MINPKKFMIPTFIATGYFSVIVVPGPILGVIIGLGIFGLGVAKGMETAKEEEADTARCICLDSFTKFQAAAQKIKMN